MHPRIGITLDHEEGGGYSQRPWYAVRQNYCDTIAQAGGVPFAVPYHLDYVTAYLDTLDGLLVTGGAFDVDPALFGEESRHDKVKLKDTRTAFEYAMINAALERNMPMLGICGGQQLLNVVLGGTLVQHIPDEFPDDILHSQPNPPYEPGHTVHASQGSLLKRITGQDSFLTNSDHHQSVRRPGKGVEITGTSADGVVEAIEVPNQRFCLGVQWHPEYLVSPADTAIFKAFVDAAAQTMAASK